MTEQTVSKKPKTPPVLRPYPLTDASGKQRWIEASTKAKALEFAFKPNIGEPLTSAETLAVIREHGVDAIEKAS